MNLNDVSIDSRTEMVKYLNFFRKRKETSLRTVDKEFSDARSDKLVEEMYSREDVEDILDFIQSGMRTLVGQDVGNLVNMGAIVVGELLEEARRKGLSLEIETKAVEDHRLLEAVERMNLESMPKSKTRVDALPSFKKEAKELRDQKEMLEGSNRELETQLKSLEKNAQRLTKEKSQLMMQMDALKMKMLETSEASTKEEDEKTTERFRKMEEDLTAAREENEKRVSETNQFQQMRKMMQTQSAKIRDLRQKLAKYEPDQVDAD
jgi:leucine zipper transcription factor-like protein 1